MSATFLTLFSVRSWGKFVSFRLEFLLFNYLFLVLLQVKRKLFVFLLSESFLFFFLTILKIQQQKKIIFTMVTWSD